MKHLDRFIDNLHNEQICIYLTRNNWKEVACLFNGRVKQFLTPDGNDAILLPIDRSFDDFYQVMTYALKTIASVENDSLQGILTKLINPSSDILKWRIADTDTALGIIPLSSMGNNIEYIKDLLSSSCLDILSPSVFHKKVMTKEVNVQMSQYKFGQTEIGSYILNLVCPLGFYQYQLFEPQIEDLPLGRRINLRIFQNIDLVQKSIAEKSSQLNDFVEEGKISVNFLNALTDLYEENKDANFSITAKWDPYVPILHPTLNDISLIPSCMEKVIEVAEKNTPTLPQDEIKSFYGKIINIGGEPEIQNRETVTITVAAIGEGGKSIKIKAELNYHEYYEVIDSAFRNGLDVKIKGTLNSTQRTISLSQATLCLMTD